MTPLPEHLAFLQREIERLTKRAAVLRDQYKASGKADVQALCEAWVCCGSVGGLTVAWNHLTGDSLMAEDVVDALGLRPR